MSDFPPGFEWSDEEQRPVYRSPAHPVEPEPRCECRHDGGPIYTLDCPLHRNDPPPQVAQAVESGERRPTESITLLWCPVCGRDDRFVSFAPKGHYHHGARCSGTAAKVTYIPEEALRLQRKRELGILAEWYRGDYLACANYCDDVLDRTGALLGRVRDAALSDSGPSKESE